MTGYDVYRHYCGLKAHFNSVYDYIKYGGKVKAKYSTYERRNDKVLFERLANKNMAYIIPFLVANFVYCDNLWIGDLVINKEAEDIYFSWKKKMSTLFRTSEEELRKVDAFLEARELNFNHLFEVEEDQQPVIFRLMTQRFISLETYIILDYAIGFSERFDRLLSDDIIYKKWSDKIKAYKPFLELPPDKCLVVCKKVFLSGNQD